MIEVMNTMHGRRIWTVDVSHFPIFHGLSILSHDLCEMMTEQLAGTPSSVYVRRAIKPRENPELVRHLGITHVVVRGAAEVISELAEDFDRFQYSLRSVLGMLHRPLCREILFPQNGHEAMALVFRIRLPAPARDVYLLLEHLEGFRQGQRSWLRMTIGDTSEAREWLGWAHQTEVDLRNWSMIAGSTRIAYSLQEGIRREAERGHRRFSEARNPYSHLFNQLARDEFAAIDRLDITWSPELVPYILERRPKDLALLFKRVLVALEDRRTRRRLIGGETLQVISGGIVVFAELSQLGRVLNLSLGYCREREGVDAFLERMPATRAVVDAVGGKPLAGVKVFLIHHITAEVLGVIAALRQLGARDLSVLFVAYSGEVPNSYLDPLLELPPEEFRCFALAHVPDGTRVEGSYQLSDRYSPLAGMEAVSEAIERRKPRYFEAMQTVAVSEFGRLIARAQQEGKPCLIVEDGGYLAPLLNDAMLQGMSMGALFRQFGLPDGDSRSVRQVLSDTWIGSVEHTRNGYDRLAAVEQVHKELAVPAVSIATSRLKVEVEARDVAASILNAIEMALHAIGKMLSRRRCLVLGSRGAIGRYLMEALSARLLYPTGALYGVDLKVMEEFREGGRFSVEARTYPELPEQARRAIDLIIGVTGNSILQGEDLEEWLLEAEQPLLILASGSTKTVEFADVSAWIDRLLVDPRPQIRGIPIRIVNRELMDPHTGKLLGHQLRISFQQGGRHRRRDLILLANLTPVNFMYYGVPTEGIDAVLAQLLSCTLRLVEAERDRSLAPRLYALDHDFVLDGIRLAQPVG